MSIKETVLKMAEEGSTRDEIQKETGARREYIGRIITADKKAPTNNDVEDEDAEQPEVVQANEEDINNDNEEMVFENDLTGANSLEGGNMGDPKTGKEYHKAWVNAKAFECSCGCTLNRKSAFCPNCGTTLDWSGF